MDLFFLHGEQQMPEGNQKEPNKVFSGPPTNLQIERLGGAEKGRIDKSKGFGRWGSTKKNEGGRKDVANGKRAGGEEPVFFGGSPERDPKIVARARRRYEDDQYNV